MASGSSHALSITGLQDQSLAGQCPDPAVVNFTVPPSSITGSADFATGLPPRGTTYGNAAVSGGALHLTDAVNSQNSYFVYDPFNGAAVYGFSLDFNIRLGGGTCCNASRFADGFSMSFANDLATPPTYSAEEGGGSGLIVCIDTWDNGGADNAPDIDVKWGGSAEPANTVAVQSLDGEREGGRAPSTPLITDPATGLPMTPWTDPNFGPVHVELHSSGKVTVDFKNVRIFTGVQTGFTPPYAGKFSFSGRTGGANENNWIDDVVIKSLIPTPEITVSGGTTTVTWVGGGTSILQSAPAVNGPWTDVPGPVASPYTIATTGPQKYFRLRE